MDPNIEEMKYAELRLYAKDLGVDCHGKTRLTKEAIISKIKAHFEQKIITEAAALVATTSLGEPTDKNTKKMKLKKSVKMAEEAVYHKDEKPVKIKKKKTSKETTTAETVAQPLCVKCATPKASAKKSKKTHKPKIELSFSQPKKSTNRVRRNLNEEANTEEPTRDVSVTEKSIELKKKKKLKKQSKSSPMAVTSVTVNHDLVSESLIESTTTVQIRATESTSEMATSSQAAMSSPAQLTFSRKSQRLSNIPNNLTTNLNRSMAANDSSLLTNDNASIDINNGQAVVEDNAANITNDIMNTTFDKSAVAKEAQQKLPTTSDDEKRISCHAFYHTSSPMAKVDAAKPGTQVSGGKPKPAGGARITRPTQVVKTNTTAASTSTTVPAVKEVKERVEVVKREAGPRIVKPTVLQNSETAMNKLTAPTQSSHAKKIEQTALNRIQKIKEGLANEKKAAAVSIVATTEPSAKKVKSIPDFKAIHEKDANKMESIDNWNQRKQERSQFLSGSKPIVKSSTDSSIATITEKTVDKPVIAKPLFTTSMHKKTPTRHAASTPRLDCILTPIVRVNEKSSLIESVSTGILSQNEPTTPIMLNGSSSSFTASPTAITPTSAVRARANSLLKSAIKNSANKAATLSNEPPPTGSFQRRKSFDLNASLSKPLKYKQYTGKLKPVDFNAKSLFLASLATGANANNETRAMENKSASTSTSSSTSGVLRPVINLNDTTTKVSSPSAQKRRESIKKVSSLRAEAGATKELLTDIAKTKATEKSSQLIKKLNGEKVKAKKQEHVDKIRNLKEVINNENQATTV